MSSDPKLPPEQGTPHDLGLDKDDSPANHEHEAERIEEDGEPFDGNFA